MESLREHAEIVEAISSGEPARSAELMRRHAELTKAAYHEAREHAPLE
jgi:DNA-binding FadR family transcriptional regulator